MEFIFLVPTGAEAEKITLTSGTSIVIVGANGSGKTRLAVHIENQLGANAHRISAHRHLTLNPKVAKIPENVALNGLWYGVADEQPVIGNRQNSRWSRKDATHLLNDYDFLLQALFAEQTNTSLKVYHNNKPDSYGPPQPFKITKLDQLKAIWERLLPHRQLSITGDDITVAPFTADSTYTASEMSDGERAIFYLIGQALVAKENQLLIIDEPELHVHPSIMSKLWDELEAARPDCAFAYITHDLQFATNRNSKKFVIRDYTPKPTWTVEAIPKDTGFSEELTTLIIGSRRPILFIEGKNTSIDMAMYRACYPDWTVIPRSSCTEVIHSVVTMRKNSELTRVTCSGIVDGDDYEQDDKDRLAGLGIQVLPVSEIENLILLPSVSSAIALSEGHTKPDADAKAFELAEAIFLTLTNDEKIENVVIEYCKRRIDRALKKVDLSDSSNLDELQRNYNAAMARINITAMAAQRTQQIKNAVATKDLPKLLEYYGNKGLVALAAKHLKNQKRDDFKEWVVRSLRNDTCKPLKDSLKAILPAVTAT